MEQLSEIEKRLAELEARISALESGQEQSGKQLMQSLSEGQQHEVAPDMADSAQIAWAGRVSYQGRASSSLGQVNWQIERPVEGLVELLRSAPEQLSAILAAMAHPLRLTLLLLLLNGPQSSQKLQEALGVSSPGQLYHHLRELLSSGIIEQQGRSTYALPARNFIPVLAMIAIVFDLARMEGTSR